MLNVSVVSECMKLEDPKNTPHRGLLNIRMEPQFRIIPIDIKVLDRWNKEVPQKESDKISTSYALVNLLKGMCGPGCFALPLAFKQAGLWGAFILVFLLGIVSSICMVKLVRCSQYLCKRNQKKTLDYGHMAEEAFKSSFPIFKHFSTAARVTVDTCLIGLQLGICCVFYIFVVDHAKEIIDVFWKDNGITRNTYFLLVLPPFLILCTIRTLKVISYICLMGNILMTICLTIILTGLIRHEHFATSELPWFKDFSGIVLAAGSILYALEGQALVLPLENRMKHPTDMKGPTGVLTTGVNLVTLIYAACGYYGYISYGDNVEDSITLNLSDSPVDFSVKCMLLCVVFFGFLIQSFPLIEMIWPEIKEKMKSKQVSRPKRIIAEYAFRYSIVFISLGLSYAIPNLRDIIPLVGVTAGMMLALVLPAGLETVCLLPMWLEEKPWWKIAIRLAFNAIFFSLGFFFVVTGFYANIVSLINGSQRHGH